MRTTRRHPSSRPFMAAPRVDFYHPAREIDSALHGIERAIRRAEGIGLVVGPAGTGKSLLLAKLAEHLRDDFDVTLLSGARICTRRALWQSILAEIGEPYRGLDEGELRIGIVERIRGLAATGSGLVILVDEAHTLPTRLLEELRLLTNVPTPMPSVHVVLSGTAELEEMLGSPKMDGVAQRIATRHYLEPLDHAETMAYLRAQVKSAGQSWESLFEPGCDDAVFTASEGVPRLINQLCDHALVRAGEARRSKASAADIAAAWRDIQRLPPPAALARAEAAAPVATQDGASDAIERFDGDGAIEYGFPSDVAAVERFVSADEGEGGGVIEFGAFEDDPIAEAVIEPPRKGMARDARPADPVSGPEVELVFDGSEDPFEEFFAEGKKMVERVLMHGPDDFSSHRHVASREGKAMARQLGPFELAAPVVREPDPPAAGRMPPHGEPAVATAEP
ncbi:MAG: ExeA family protein, partial [Planctomycetia bacterium]